MPLRVPPSVHEGDTWVLWKTQRRWAAQDRRDVGGRHKIDATSVGGTGSTRHRGVAPRKRRFVTAESARKCDEASFWWRRREHPSRPTRESCAWCKDSESSRARQGRLGRPAGPARQGRLGRPAGPESAAQCQRPPGGIGSRGIGRLLRPSHKQEARPPKGPGLPREAVRLTARAPRPVRRAQCSRTWCW